MEEVSQKVQNARDGCWLGDAGAASWVAGGRASSARAGGGWVQNFGLNLESQGTVLLTISVQFITVCPLGGRRAGAPQESASLASLERAPTYDFN